MHWACYKSLYIIIALLESPPLRARDWSNLLLGARPTSLTLADWWRRFSLSCQSDASFVLRSEAKHSDSDSLSTQHPTKPSQLSLFSFSVDALVLKERIWGGIHNICFSRKDLFIHSLALQTPTDCVWSPCKGSLGKIDPSCDSWHTWKICRLRTFREIGHTDGQLRFMRVPVHRR